MMVRRVFGRGSESPVRTRRSAFTLIELLVVIAIIGVLVVLLMPAVQKGAKPPRRTQCLNHIKQLCSACHNYADTYKSFPAGYIDQPGIVYDVPFNQPITLGVQNIYEADGTLLSTKLPLTINQWALFPPWGWHTFLLPQIEQQTISIDFRRGKDLPENLEMIKIPVETFLCPSRHVARHSPQGIAFSNYRGVMGGATAQRQHPVSAHRRSLRLRDERHFLSEQRHPLRRHPGRRNGEHATDGRLAIRILGRRVQLLCPLPERSS